MRPSLLWWGALISSVLAVCLSAPSSAVGETSSATDESHASQDVRRLREKIERDVNDIVQNGRPIEMQNVEIVPPDGKPRKARVNHVVTLGIDGLHPGCLFDVPGGVPNIKTRLADQGAWTLTNARTTIQTISAPGWSTHLCGMGPTSTGVYSNGWAPPWTGQRYQITPVTGSKSPFPCVFQTLRSQVPSAQTAMFYDWLWLFYLGNNSIPNSLTRERFCPGDGARCDPILARQGAQYLRETLPTASKSHTFIFFNAVDESGHQNGWCTPGFQKTVHGIDKLVGQVLDAIDDVNMTSEVLVILTSDHGGNKNGTNHGSQNDDCLLIPLFLRGPGIKKNYQLQRDVRNEDIAPTEMYALGLQPSVWWKGKPIIEAFEPVAPPVSSASNNGPNLLAFLLLVFISLS